jgi:DNA polymerase I-like protein with 3'-5' exonuclease and polymerase domains
MKIIDTENLRFDTGTYGDQSLTSNEREWIYNGFDAAVTLEVRDALLPQLDSVARHTYDFSRALQGPIMEMTLRGLLVDQNRRGAVLHSTVRDIEILNTQLMEIVSEGVGFPCSSPLWWRSNAQLQNLFYKVMELKPIKKRNANGIFAPTVNREAIEKLSINFYAEPICNHILALRDLDKKRSFLETGIDADGRFRYGFNIAGTNTGRLSSSASDFGTGSNSQNISRSLRSIFCADRGMKFCNIDLEQADSRNLGAMCWNIFKGTEHDAVIGRYLDACESGDLHTFVCRMANPQLPWPEERKGWRAIADEIAYRDFSYRDMAKRLGHGTNFYGTAPTMAMHTKIPVSNVREFQSGYFEGFPEIQLFHKWVREQLHTHSSLTTLFNRRRHFFGRAQDDSTLREAISFCPQSMTGEEINIGLLNIFRSGKVQILVQVHDSLLFQYPEELEDEIVPWAIEAIKAPLVLKGGREFCVPTEAKVGWNWGDIEMWNKDHVRRGMCLPSQVGSVKDNPDGLIKYKGNDSRKRISHSKLRFK